MSEVFVVVNMKDTDCCDIWRNVKRLQSASVTLKK